ncbi:hypothetical protein FLM48_00475 [Shewanella sp. Scap07]|uniref:hypothetical protein n=1 Tax=Shewanella sp. Scap07 TaxID=2589987 RepID=UPI0015B9D423|nr:hypothetical protein [Shewanella sp. Scap07]QLE83695.1 hypothetical protein FLM48_00475 [Shewanella sp. Scap07]
MKNLSRVVAFSGLILVANAALAAQTVYGSFTFGYNQANASANAKASLLAQYPSATSVSIHHCINMQAGPGWRCMAVGQVQ